MVSTMTQANAAPVRVVLVGFEDQDNLGLRYLSSTLKRHGYATRIVTITGGPEPVLQAVRELNPHIVGFSLIFQFLVPQFAVLLGRLREAGVTAHFTMGGHYASFEPETLLAAIPELDTVVRFEGEETLLELAERIASELTGRMYAGLHFAAKAGWSLVTVELAGRISTSCRGPIAKIFVTTIMSFRRPLSSEGVGARGDARSVRSSRSMRVTGPKAAAVEIQCASLMSSNTFIETEG